ncbi:unnamed protein product [Trichobilharzia szidati]|nr:unnamed protein product [Trichobilharzia szidati]
MDDLCLMSHKLEDLQLKTNKLVEEADSKDRTSSDEQREDLDDEDSQPTTADTGHYRWVKDEGAHFLHFSRQYRLTRRWAVQLLTNETVCKHCLKEFRHIVALQS